MQKNNKEGGNNEMLNLEEIENLLNTNELNRLQRAAKNKDKKEILKWADMYDKQLNKLYYEEYKKKYMTWLEETFKDLNIAICYTLHFNEKTKFGNARLKSFMDDLTEIMKGFYRKDFLREDYEKQLLEDKIKIE